MSSAKTIALLNGGGGGLNDKHFDKSFVYTCTICSAGPSVTRCDLFGRALSGKCVGCHDVCSAESAAHVRSMRWGQFSLGV